LRTFSRFVFLLALCAVLMPAAVIVGEPAGSNNCFPFGCNFAIGTRYQQAYSSAEFPGTITIYGITFYNTYNPGANLTDATFTFSLSTITAGIDTLSNTNFDSNLGGDNTLFATQALSGASAASLTIWGTPFTYNPANGNLLLDIALTNINLRGGVYFESRNGANGIFSRYHDFGTGTIGTGLVTGFETGAGEVPEPATFALLGAGLAALALRRRAA
jgi:hypothetical protein